MKKFIKTLAIVLCLSTVTPVVAPSIGVETVEAATKIKLNCTKKTMYVGDTFKLKISGTKKKVKWSSSDKRIATVSSKGIVKGIKEGDAKIIAVVSGKKYTCSIKVKNVVSATDGTVLKAKLILIQETDPTVCVNIEISTQVHRNLDLSSL